MEGNISSEKQKQRQVIINSATLSVVLTKKIFFPARISRVGVGLREVFLRFRRVWQETSECLVYGETLFLEFHTLI